MTEQKRNIKRENFLRISESRVNKIVMLFGQLTNLNNSSFYDCTEDDINLIFDTLQNEMDKSKEILLKSLKKKKNKIEF